MSRVKAAVCAAALVALVHGMPAQAAEPERGIWSVGVGAGMLGLGPEVGYRFNRAFGVRANGWRLNVNTGFEDDETDFDLKLKFKSVGISADVYPFGGSLRLSAGLRSNRNKIVGAVTALYDDEPVEIGDGEYSPEELGTLTGTVSFKKLVPTLTLGWGKKFRKGFGITSEMGIMLQGSPRLALSSSGTLANDPDFQRDLEEWRADKEHDARKFRFWPVVQTTLVWRF